MNQIDNKEVGLPITKRIFDIIISILAIIILSPAWILIIIAIAVDGFLIKKNNGPIFYKEIRISQGKPFVLRKFRILKVSSYEVIQNNGGTVHTKPLEKDAGNLTFTGKFLKKFYLDEAPQLLSVLFGDMSFVGTRPWNPVDYQKELDKGEYRKKIIKAGLTGPVQIHKNDAKNFGGEQKLDHDYINLVRSRGSFKILLFDIWILLKSVLFIIKGQGL